MPRPRFKPTQEQRLMVKSMAAYGVQQEDIGKVVGLRSPKTLRKHFREEITRGSIDAIARSRSDALSNGHVREACGGYHLLSQDEGQLA
jgi:hypothetical protein